ncbi:hypothetical protein [Longimicrobium sp.]|uniref:hypothetical protein n=1 Tax=Longimicrobium sp. TaxID=2029185 RepID=UPI002C95E274|nr:hypothetical protein [Longimicrobium sp.]HSU12511.1 hypothetical protein [Longimicrobium sp.]
MTPRGALLSILTPVLLLAAPGVAARAAAQTPPQWKSTVTASVIVAPPPILLTTTRDLYFGNVSPGQVVSVPARPAYPVGTWAAGARFGNLAKTVRYGVRFTLPTQLANGTATMPVSWNGTQYGWLCVWNQSTGTAGVCAVQDASFNPSSHTTPAAALVIDLPNNTPQNNVFAADVYVGGQLSVPAGSLKPGTYSAPVTITVTVIG